MKEGTIPDLTKKRDFKMENNKHLLELLVFEYSYPVRGLFSDSWVLNGIKCKQKMRFKNLLRCISKF